MSARKSVYFVSLGCPKNRVDTEVMLGGALSRGHEIVTDPARADVIVVNTCGFIGEAKEESVDTILEMARYKSEGSCRKLVVTGCLTQRYPKEVADEIPEVDKIFGSGEVARVAAALDDGDASDKIEVEPEPSWLYDAATARELAGPSYSAYVKIAEGCDRPCAFCIIPKLRGAQRSRRVDDVVTEVEQLVARGTREVNLIAQDLTKYGDDLPEDGRPNLAGLLRRVARVPGLRWVRLHYAYPTAVTDELIQVIAEEPTVVKYLDVPLQHADDEVLRRMRRGHTERLLRRLVDRLRRAVPEIVIRTTFLVGHPGETQASFDRLCGFVEEMEFDRVGVFTFSSEEGTVSATLGDTVAARVAKARRTALMRLQRAISKRKQKALVGRELEVLVEGASDESEYLLAGRWAGQAPEIDGVVYLADGQARAGDFVRARVTGYADYDLAASIVDVSDPRKRAVGVRLPVLG
jgi:ribosomal protein S12 methylthiotransferase